MAPASALFFAEAKTPRGTSDATSHHPSSRNSRSPRPTSEAKPIQPKSRSRGAEIRFTGPVSKGKGLRETLRKTFNAWKKAG